jgi:hypothetical protein
VTRIRYALLLIIGSVLMVLVFVEAVARLVGINEPPLVAPDEVRGWSLVSNRPGVTNRLGMRDRERTIAKSDGSVRIAILGDSMAEGIQVARADTFPAVLEMQLNQDETCFGGRPVEVLNFAVQGYGTAQQYLTLDRHVWPFDPDLVLLAAFPGNDIRDNSKALKGNLYLPFYHLKDGALALDTSFRSHWSYHLRAIGARIIQHSLLAQMINQVRGLLKAQIRANTDRQETLGAGLGEAGIDNMVFLDPPPPEWAAAWDVTEALIARANADARARTVPFHLAVLGTAIEGNPDPATRAALAKAINMDDLSYPHRRLAKLAATEKFALLDLTEPVRAHATATQTCLYGEPGAPECTGHYTAAGHKVVAEQLAAHLCVTARD